MNLENHDPDWVFLLREANAGDERAAARVLTEMSIRMLTGKPLPTEILEHWVNWVCETVGSRRSLVLFPGAPRRRGRKGLTWRMELVQAMRIAELRAEGLTPYDSKNSIFHKLAADEGLSSPEEIEKRAASLRRKFERSIAAFKKKYGDVSPDKT